MAPLPAGQSRLRVPGPGADARAARRRGLKAAALAALSGWLALALARDAGVVGLGAMQETARVAAAAVVLFGLAGFGVVRLWLPAALRTHEALWILPVGACTAALTLTFLGFCGVPLVVSLGVVLAAGAALGVLAVRRRGLPARPPAPGRLLWPVWIAVLLACVALVPMFRGGFPTVIGAGSDAVLAVGTADFLQDNHPLSVAEEEPLDRVPLVWRSKQPVYYGLAGVAQLSGMAVHETIAVLAALLLALTALGFYLAGRHLLGASVGAAVLAMAAVGLDRMVLHTVVHPYFNQTWGLFALPFALVLGWRAVREPTRATVGLLALFAAVLAFAYPLALPILGVALAGFAWTERRRLPRPSLRRVWKGPRTLLWLVPAALVFAVPVLGVVEKGVTALRVLIDPSHSLRAWGGDLLGWFGEHEFVGLASPAMLAVLALPLAAVIALELRRHPRGLALGLGAVLAFGLAAAVLFRLRDYGWYFHFKALAFVGPVAVLIAVVGLARLPRVGMALAALYALVALGGAREEAATTFDQLPRQVLAVQEVDRMLPASASVRLDMEPPEQMWVGHFLAGQPVCAERPLLDTNYPHVAWSRRADYALANVELRRPRDAVGRPLWRGERYVLYRLGDALPGPDRCSRALVETVTAIR